MDYESKYNELVEAVRAVVEGNPGLCKIDEGLGRLHELLPEKESEDERIRKELLEVIRHCYEDGGYALCTDDYKKYSAYLEKQKEQKPTNSEKPNEWSEEDEKYLNLAINIVASDLGEDSPTVSWLKSIRPQPHWKPSEWQVAMLRAVLNDHDNITSESANIALESLYNDLRKLI